MHRNIASLIKQATFLSHGGEQFARQDSSPSQVFELIVSTGEKIYVVVRRQLKDGKTAPFCFPSMAQKRLVLCLNLQPN